MTDSRAWRLRRLPEVGELRHRITIEHMTKVPDGHRGFTETWATFATVWARVQPVSSREYFFAQGENTEITHFVTIRYLAGIKADMRIRFGGSVLTIEGPPINVDARGAFMELMCKE